MSLYSSVENSRCECPGTRTLARRTLTSSVGVDFAISHYYERVRCEILGGTKVFKWKAEALAMGNKGKERYQAKSASARAFRVRIQRRTQTSLETLFENIQGMLQENLQYSLQGPAVCLFGKPTIILYKLCTAI